MSEEEDSSVRSLMLAQIVSLLQERQVLDHDIMELEADRDHLREATLKLHKIINQPSSLHLLHPKHLKAANQSTHCSSRPNNMRDTGNPSMKMNEETTVESSTSEPHSLSKETALTPIHEEDFSCCVCFNGDSENMNLIIMCEGCNLSVHQACYGVRVVPEGPWYCRACERNLSPEDKACVLCPVRAGALKEVVENPELRSLTGKRHGNWAHVLCTLWNDDTYFVDTSTMEPVAGIEKVLRKPRMKACYICGYKHGAILRCCYEDDEKQIGKGKYVRCDKYFHATCGHNNRCSLEISLGNDGLQWNATCEEHAPKKIVVSDSPSHSLSTSASIPATTHRDSVLL